MGRLWVTGVPHGGVDNAGRTEQGAFDGEVLGDPGLHGGAAVDDVADAAFGQPGQGGGGGQAADRDALLADPAQPGDVWARPVQPGAVAVIPLPPTTHHVVLTAVTSGPPRRRITRAMDWRAACRPRKR